DTSNREEYFDEILCKERKNCEHSFAWMDAYKALLVRYDKLDISWLAMNLMGMMSIFIKKYQAQIIANCDI
ncbi:MAG: IS5/IS1182 family transposase, partial [Bacteroidota bacterium]